MTFFLFSLLALASLRDPDLIPEPKVRCDRPQWNSCVREHTALAETEAAAARDLERKLLLLSGDRGILATRKAALEEDSRRALLSLTMIEQELAGSLVDSASEGLEIFAWGPRPGEWPALPGGTSIRSEKNGDARRASLEKEMHSLRDEAGRFQEVVPVISRQITDLEGKIRGFEERKKGHEEQARLHVYQCRDGCRERFCPFP